MPAKTMTFKITHFGRNSTDPAYQVDATLPDGTTKTTLAETENGVVDAIARLMTDADLSPLSTKEEFHQAWHEAMTGQTKSWDEFDWEGE